MSTKSASEHKERRRYPRLASHKPARLEYAGRSFACEIRDYCQAGFYLAFPDEETAHTDMPMEQGSALKVIFSVGQGTEARTLVVEGRAARAAATSVGVHVEAMPEDVFQALQAVGVEPPILAANRAGTDLASEEKQRIRQECTRRFSAFLDAVLQDFFALAASKLVDASYAVSYLEQSRYVFGARELDKQRAQIQEAFFASIRRGLQEEGQASEKASAVFSPDELSLVDENDFDDWLHMTSVSNRLETEFQEQLTGIEKRFSLLVGHPVDRQSNPFGPVAICRALQDGILTLDFTLGMRAELYKAWGTVLAQHLAELYEQLRTVLLPLQPAATSRKTISRGSTTRPDASKEAGSTAASTGAESSGAGVAGRDEIAESLAKLYRQMQAGGQAVADGADFNLDRILAAANQPQGKGGAGYGWSRPSTFKRRRVAPGSYDAGGLSRLTAALQLTGLQAKTRWVAPPATFQASAGQAQATVEEVVAVIDSLPLETLAAGARGAEGPSLAELVMAQLAEAGGGNRRIAPAYRQTLDGAASLFSRARAEHVPSSDIEFLLKRLERPMLKLALRDGSFMDSLEHPARAVVNLLDQYAITADDRGKFFDAKLQRFLSMLVDRICSQGTEDVSVFEVVRDKLERVLQPIRQARRNRVFRLQEACEGRERIRNAREQVNAALDERLAGRSVPALLMRLVDIGWRQYLVLLQMRQDSGGDEWNQALAVLDQLLAHLASDQSLWPGYAEEALALQREVERRLAMINADAPYLRDLLEDLALALIPGEERQSLLGETVAVPSPKSSGQAEEALGTDTQATLLQRLNIGDWWDFQLEGHWLPMQLIWMNEPTTSCAFANRSATNRLELGLGELARQVEADLVRLDREQELPLLERSEYSLFDDSYRRLIDLAHHDPITGLLNRSGLLHQLARFASADRLDQMHALCLLEFDQCRVVYNACGTEAGDTLLRDLAAELQTKLRPGDLLAALATDAFAVFLPDRDEPEGRRVADGLMQQLKDYRFRHGNDTYSMGLSIGLTQYSPSLVSLDDAIRHADSACQAAKSQSRNRIQVYEASDAQLRTQESLLEWAGRIDSILECDGLSLRCQKVMPIDGDTPLLPYYEVLLGIRDAAGLDVPPMLFIPAVERWKRSHEIDLWVLRGAFEWIRSHRALFDQTGGFSLNLSALSLGNPEIISYLHGELGRGDLPTEKIAFEITETTAIDSYDGAQEFIRQIRRYGCRFALDDFGSGFASYSHLKNLHLDTLKIDGSFVKEIGNSQTDYAMVKSMNDIGHSLGLKTVAEYVESPLILDKLREIGVDYAQGYVIHKPAPIQELLA